MPPGRNVAVFRDAEGVFAVSTVCTHLGCIVKPTRRGLRLPVPRLALREGRRRHEGTRAARARVAQGLGKRRHVRRGRGRGRRARDESKGRQGMSAAVPGPVRETALRRLVLNLKGAPRLVKESAFRGGTPSTDRTRSTFVFGNVFLHLHAVRTHRWSLRWSTTWGLGIAAMAAFLVTLVTGVLLMFYYKPHPLAAYDSIKDIHFVVPTGRFIRNIHRWAANVDGRRRPPPHGARLLHGGVPAARASSTGSSGWRSSRRRSASPSRATSSRGTSSRTGRSRSGRTSRSPRAR